jgi:di/tricarboxylate transporter
MGQDAYFVLGIVLIATILFITEAISIDLVALLVVVLLIVSGVITPQEGVAGFSNPATLTVAFMFVLSAAILKTGALQSFGVQLSPIFRKRPGIGVGLMILLVGVISAFVNNTPVVAVLIPVVIQIAHTTNIPPSQLLIPLSFGTIFGGTCSLIGTSTNILVNGIVIDSGLPEISMFEMTPLGLVFLVVGIIYFMLIGRKLLPKDRPNKDLKDKFGMNEYLTEITLKENADAVGKAIMDSSLVKELEMDIIEIRRDGFRYSLPQGDFILNAGDILKARCDVSKIKRLKDRVSVEVDASFSIGDDSLESRNSTLMEIVVTANSYFEGKTLRQVDFRRRYRAITLAIRHREEIIHEHLHDVKLKSGDVILAEVKSHFVKELKKMENQQGSPFIILSEDAYIEFNKRNFIIVGLMMLGIVGLAAFEVISIMVASLIGVVLLALTKFMDMREVYQAINWQIVFLLAGTLSLGVAIAKSGLAAFLALQMINVLGPFGPVVVVSGLYLITTLLTELMSNNATAALIAPIAIAIAAQMGLSPMPFLMAVTFAASASFLTPIGYQTNAMVYSAGQYKFSDFIRVGWPLSLMFWILATLLIPVFYPF